MSQYEKRGEINDDEEKIILMIKVGVYSFDKSENENKRKGN